MGEKASSGEPRVAEEIASCSAGPRGIEINHLSMRDAVIKGERPNRVGLGCCTSVLHSTKVRHSRGARSRSVKLKSPPVKVVQCWGEQRVAAVAMRNLSAAMRAS